MTGTREMNECEKNTWEFAHDVMSGQNGVMDGWIQQLDRWMDSMDGWMEGRIDGGMDEKKTLMHNDQKQISQSKQNDWFIKTQKKIKFS